MDEWMQLLLQVTLAIGISHVGPTRCGANGGISHATFTPSYTGERVVCHTPTMLDLVAGSSGVGALISGLVLILLAQAGAVYPGIDLECTSKTSAESSWPWATHTSLVLIFVEYFVEAGLLAQYDCRHYPIHPDLFVNV